MNRPLVSVIVPTKNSARTLAACLASVRSQTYSPLELIVVDNASTDATPALAAAADVFVTFGPERSAQRNEGVRRARGEYVAVIDSDMTLSPDVIARCVDAMQAGIVGVVIPEESFGDGFWAQCKALERSYYAGVAWMEAARFFRRADYLAAGGYDESLVSGEDWDLSQRISAMGALARCEARIRHDEGRLTLGGTLRKKWYYARMFASYARKTQHASALGMQANPLRRYALFFARPDRLFRRPLVGLGMLFMKTAEFAVGALGMVLQRAVTAPSLTRTAAAPAGPVKILIVHGRTPNLGDRAIAVTMAAQLRAVMPGCHITYDADDVATMQAGLPDEKTVPALLDVTKVRGAAGTYGLAYVLRNARFLLASLATYAHVLWCAAFRVRGCSSPLHLTYRDADVIVWAGGDYVADVYGPRIWLRLLELWSAKRWGKKVAIYAQTFGPFGSLSGRLAAFFLRRADLLLPRDDGSEAYLRSLGITANVERVADCVIAMPPRFTPEVERLDAQYGFRGAAVFALIASQYVHVNDETYRRYELGMLAAMHRAKERGMRVVLLAAATEDYEASCSFVKRYGLAFPVLDATVPEPDEVKALLSRAALLYSSRMHPVILATSSGVPTAGVSPLAKMRHYLALVGCEGLTLPLAECDEVTAVKLFDRLHDERERVASAVMGSIVPLTRMSLRNAEAVKELVYGRRT